MVIDVHAHAIVPAAMARLEAMDRQGVDIQLVSPSPAHYCDWADAALAAKIAATVNGAIAELSAARPDRIRGLGFAPLHVAEDALVEAVSGLGLHGVEISTFGAGTDCRLALGERLDRYYLSNLVGQNVEHAGTLVHASQTENPELLWAARGGGPGFLGVVVRFWLRTRPRPQAMRKSVYAYEVAQWDVMADWFARVQKDLPPTIETVMLTTAIPDLGDGQYLLVSGVAFTDTPQEAHAALAPLETCPLIDSALLRVVEVPTSIVQEFADQYRANPEGHRYTADDAWLGGPPKVTVPALRPLFTDLPGAKVFSLWFSMDPLRELPDMAFSRQAEIYFASYVVWEHEGDDDRYRTWLRERMAALPPATDGCYLGDSDFQVRPTKFLSDEAWPRFAALRDRYDPDRTFVGYLGENAHE